MMFKSLILTGILFGSCVIIVEPARNIPKWKKQACALPSHSEYSHYICNANGDVKCLPGWTGDLCDVPKCRKNCDPMNGYCKRPGECRCKIGFYGENCNRCIPLPGCQHGYCNVSFECACEKGWDGLFCSEPICQSDCHSTRGYCELPNECRCRFGWSGKTCQECQVLPGCVHGTCQKPLECKCLPGWTGLLCQTPICAKSCHKEHGYCKRPGECRCRVGWIGENCTECYPYPGCKNGTCNRPWECKCADGWGGMLCDEELNYCEKNPDTCKNMGQCNSILEADGSFNCNCPDGFTGEQCEHMMETMEMLDMNFDDELTNSTSLQMEEGSGAMIVVEDDDDDEIEAQDEHDKDLNKIEPESVQSSNKTANKITDK